MKLVMTLLVRDEEDIIRANIDYHLSMGVDFIIATDNCSIDGTKNILKEYEAQGKLFYIYESKCNHNQHEWVTKMARLASSKYGADWVINNDADEFWWPMNHKTLKEAFLSIEPIYNVIQAERKNFVSLTDMDITEVFYKQMIFKDLFSLNPIKKPLQPKQAHISDERVVVKQGNHGVKEIGDQYVLHDMIEIFHFPVRSYQQNENKIIQGGKAYAINTELGKEMGNAWRKLYGEYLEDGNLNRYFNRISYDKNRIDDEIKSKKIQKDTRLRDYINSINNN